MTFTRACHGKPWKVNVLASSKRGHTTSKSSGRMDSLSNGHLGRLVNALIEQCDEHFGKKEV